MEKPRKRERLEYPTPVQIQDVIRDVEALLFKLRRMSAEAQQERLRLKGINW